MDGRYKSLYKNIYAKVFANEVYFLCIYPMDYKDKSRYVLYSFFQELGFPKPLTFDYFK